MALGQIRAISSSLLIRVPAPSTSAIKTSKARLPSRTGLSPSRSTLCFTYNRKGPNENTESPFSLDSISVMLPEALDSEQREPTELLRDIGHDFPRASQGLKEGAPGIAGDT